MMSKNLLKFVLPMILLLAVCAGAAHAALQVNVVTDEFSVESPYPVSTVKECECGTRAEIIEVINLGDFDTLFTVEVFSPIIDQIALSESRFSLKPHETRKLNAYINAPCDTSVTSFYVIRVSTNYGRSKELYKNFESKACQNIKFTSRMLNETVLPGQTACSEISLENSGSFTDNFRLSSPLPYTYPSRSEVVLGAGDDTKLLVCTQMPIDVYGMITQPFMITSDKAGNSAYGEEEYEILRDYDFTIKTEDFDLSVCEDVTTKSLVTVQNLASTPNEYQLVLRGPGFVNLSQYSMSLAGHESDSILLSASPGELDVGQYEVTLNARTKYGNLAKDKNFRLIVNNCFETDVTINDAAQISDRDCCGRKEYTLRITNRGLYEETYQLVVDSEGWVSVDPSDEFVRLRPGQQADVRVYADLPCTEEKQTSFIQVKQLRAPYETHEIRLDLESVGERACYNVDLVQERYGINYETETIPLLLQNNGLRGGLYRIELGETNSSFLALAEDNVTIMPGELAVVHVVAGNHSAYEEGNYLDRLSLVITPAEYGRVDYERQFWVVLKDKSFLEKAWAYIMGFNYGVIGFCGLATIVLILVLAGGIFAAWYLKNRAKISRIKASKIRKLRIANMAVVALLLVGLLVLVFLGAPDETRFYDEPSNTTNPLFLEWKENTQMSIDLDQFFTDPDLDNLTYTATQPDHVQVKIDGSRATLTPEHGWSGLEYVIFTADDGKGGKARSEAMSLHILHKRPLTFLDYWSLYCRQVNIALLMLILLVALTCADIVEEKGYRKYQRS